MSDASKIRSQLDAYSFYDLLDIASGIQHAVSTRARLTQDRWTAIARVLRRHGIDPESPTAASDLDHRLRGVSNA